jgi:hypothetical protein
MIPMDDVLGKGMFLYMRVLLIMKLDEKNHFLQIQSFSIFLRLWNLVQLAALLESSQ